MAELGGFGFQQLNVTAGGLMVENFKLSFFPLLKINDLDRHHILQLLLCFSGFLTLKHHQTDSFQ